MFEIIARFGKYKVPVRVDADGAALILTFPYFDKLVDEVKGMDLIPPGWDAANKCWRVKNCKRNLFTIQVWTGKGAIERYDAPIKDHISFEHTFWGHQVDMFNFIMSRHRCILAAEMRTGKTYPSLKAVETVGAHTWWVAPKSALRGLQNELKKRDFRGNLKLITYDSFATMVHGEQFTDVPKFLVFDEMQKLKNPTSKRGEAARIISELMEDEYKGEEYVVGLSGTPAPRDPSDWWNLAEVTRPGWLRESSQAKLLKRLAVMEQQEGQVGQIYLKNTGWKQDEVAYLYKRLSGLVLVKLKKDCLDLPPKSYDVRTLVCSAKVKLICRTIVNQETSILQATQKLRQLSDGFLYENEADECGKMHRVGTKFIGTPKLDELTQDIEEHEDIGRLVVYAGFQGSVDLITEKFVSLGWIVLQIDGRGWKVFGEHTTEECIDAMDRSLDTGAIERLAVVAQSDSAGTGLEFSATPTVIYYSNSDSGDARMQSEDRPYSNNMDTQRGLRIIDYCYLPTDAKMLARLKEKKDLQSLTLGELKKEVENV